MFLLLVLVVALLWLIGQAQGNPSQSAQGEGQTSNALQSFTQAWANAEGWNVSGSRARRNNNPANLVGGDYIGVTGQDSQGFDQFDTASDGWAAAEGYVTQNAFTHPGWSFKNFFAKVLGNLSGTPVNNDQGNSDQEATNVASYLGVPSDTNLNDYIGG